LSNSKDRARIAETDEIRLLGEEIFTTYIEREC
jgi:hypothetical protein